MRENMNVSLKAEKENEKKEQINRSQNLKHTLWTIKMFRLRQHPNINASSDMYEKSRVDSRTPKVQAKIIFVSDVLYERPPAMARPFAKQ